MTIFPKPTLYRGEHFKSRLEARWAIFFDQLGIPWLYEPVTMTFSPDGWKYSPDFLLTFGMGLEEALTRTSIKGKMFIEVKPVVPRESEFNVYMRFQREAECNLLLGVGSFYKSKVPRILALRKGARPRTLPNCGRFLKSKSVWYDNKTLSYKRILNACQSASQHRFDI